MEHKEITNVEGVEILRHHFLVEGLTAEQINAWAESPITRALMLNVGKDGIMLALQYEEDCAMVHIAVPLNMREAVNKQSWPCDLDNFVKDGPGVIVRENPLLKDDTENHGQAKD